MLSEKFYDVIDNEGSVSITSWTNKGAHVTCTWNSYLQVVKENNIEKILIPAAGMTSTENDDVILTMAAREVEGFNGYQGTGFRIIGSAEFLNEGDYFNQVHDKYSFANRALVVTVKEAKQLL
jgi:pyridoxamine 5'-phosphate oxidase-related FMN-binding